LRDFASYLMNTNIAVRTNLLFRVSEDRQLRVGWCWQLFALARGVHAVGLTG
jgi:hypothetical protein